MKPKSLRHCLEKAAKALVLIQQQTPNVECILDEGKGEHGHIILKFDPGSADKIKALGRKLEDKGYRFKIKKSPWLGQITYLGKANQNPSIIFILPITKDRLTVNKNAPEQQLYSFR